MTDATLADAVAAAFLLAGALTPIRWSTTRYGPYTLRCLSVAAYLAIGPRAAWMTLAAGAIGAGAFAAYGRWRARPRADTSARIGAVVMSAIASAAGIGAGVLVARAFDVGYPVPIAPLSSMPMQIRFWAIVNVVAAVALVVDELLVRTLVRPAADDPTLTQLEPAVSSYVLAGITSAPLTFAAQAVFDSRSILPWIVALSWTFLLNAAFARQLERRRRIGELIDELATKERLAAVGEVGARVVHQTRHQLGLIGITAHRIEKRVSSLAGDDARVVREELAKLGEVQRELSDMLTGVLRQTTRDEPPVSYADVVVNVARRLEPLALSRGVELAIGDLADAKRARPLHADNVGDAIFNVLENALVAARAKVVVTAASKADKLVLTVSDDGPGVPESVLSRAATPFVTTKADGTGMGLAIARAAVEGERGELAIANDPSGGCRVAIVVPDA